MDPLQKFILSLENKDGPPGTHALFDALLEKLTSAGMSKSKLTKLQDTVKEVKQYHTESIKNVVLLDSIKQILTENKKLPGVSHRKVEEVLFEIFVAGNKNVYDASCLTYLETAHLKRHVSSYFTTRYTPLVKQAREILESEDYHDLIEEKIKHIQLNSQKYILHNEIVSNLIKQQTEVQKLVDNYSNAYQKMWASVECEIEFLLLKASVLELEIYDKFYSESPVMASAMSELSSHVTTLIIVLKQDLQKLKDKILSYKRIDGTVFQNLLKIYEKILAEVRNSEETLSHLD